MKMAGSFWSADGGSNFCSIFSVIDTVSKNGGNPFKALAALFNNSFSLSFLSKKLPRGPEQLRKIKESLEKKLTAQD